MKSQFRLDCDEVLTSVKVKIDTMVFTSNSNKTNNRIKYSFIRIGKAKQNLIAKGLALKGYNVLSIHIIEPQWDRHCWGLEIKVAKPIDNR